MSCRTANRYLEGALTSETIQQSRLNTFYQFFNGSDRPPEKVIQFLLDQHQWVTSMATRNAKTSTYWRHVQLILCQLNGMLAGYNDFANAKQSPPLQMIDFLLLNAAGDLFDIVPAVDENYRPNWQSMSKDQIADMLLLRGHCSGFVKVSEQRHTHPVEKYTCRFLFLIDRCYRCFLIFRSYIFLIHRGFPSLGCFAFTSITAFR